MAKEITTQMLQAMETKDESIAVRLKFSPMEERVWQLIGSSNVFAVTNMTGAEKRVQTTIPDNA